jgi:hypothetical protein
MQRNINGMKRKKIEDEVKVRLPQCLINHYAMRTVGGGGGLKGINMHFLHS